MASPDINPVTSSNNGTSHVFIANGKLQYLPASTLQNPANNLLQSNNHRTVPQQHRMSHHSTFSSSNLNLNSNSTHTFNQTRTAPISPLVSNLTSPQSISNYNNLLLENSNINLATNNHLLASRQNSSSSKLVSSQPLLSLNENISNPLNNHLNLTNLRESSEPSKLDLICPRCQNQSDNQKDFNLHIKYCGKVDSKLIKCPQCNKELTSERNLAEHLKTHAPAQLREKFYCDEDGHHPDGLPKCNKGKHGIKFYNSEHELVKHRRDHHNKGWFCYGCNTRFNWRGNYTKHLKKTINRCDKIDRSILHNIYKIEYLEEQFKSYLTEWEKKIGKEKEQYYIPLPFNESPSIHQLIEPLKERAKRDSHFREWNKYFGDVNWKIVNHLCETIKSKQDLRKQPKTKFCDRDKMLMSPGFRPATHDIVGETKGEDKIRGQKLKFDSQQMQKNYSC